MRDLKIPPQGWSPAPHEPKAGWEDFRLFDTIRAVKQAIFLLSLAYSATMSSAQTPAPNRTLLDYGNLRRYAAENAKLPPPQSGEERVVFMGDSITDGWCRRYGKFFPGKPYINRGIGGQVTPQMLLRFRQDVLALKPAAVVILGGTNDIGGSSGPIPAEATQNNLMTMIDLARAHGIKPVLATLLPVCDYISPQTQRRPMEKIRELNEWMKSYARSEGITLLDYFPATLDEAGALKKELTYDGLHPNDAGYEVMMPLAAKAIADALGR
ncbi:MAG: SGNH/GDSL hydrolase family protein [Candidatus Solibacter usitatus]|nr:SGNH/GDSL hydrolase family protein [Candidatus Solibacter usitatus]